MLVEEVTITKDGGSHGRGQNEIADVDSRTYVAVLSGIVNRVDLVKRTYGKRQKD